MKKIKLIFILSALSFFVQGQDKYVYLNETMTFKPRFVEDGYVILKHDSLILKISADTDFVNIDHVRTKDKGMIWLFYKNRGLKDFWKTSGGYNAEEDQKSPKKLIDKYFFENEIGLGDVFIFMTSIKSHLFSPCDTCYNGTNYLFKIKMAELKHLQAASKAQFESVKTEKEEKHK